MTHTLDREVASALAPLAAMTEGLAPPLDIFCGEDVECARRIAAAGILVELHVHPGVPHGFEACAPDADVSRRVRADRLRVLRSL